jgi:hypothetical protein
MSEPEGVEPDLGGLQSVPGVFPCPGESTHRVIGHRGDLAHGESPRAGQTGQGHRVAAVGCDPLAGCWGEHRGDHHPAGVAGLAQIAVELVAIGAGVGDEEPWDGLGGPRDDMVLELAVKAGCDAIVTYNQRDFAGVEETFQVRVVTPGEFLKDIGA